MLPAAFYLPDGDSFVATELTRGPWDAGLQHGGPPAALLGRAAERFGGDGAGFVLARLTVDFVAPLRIAPMRVEARPLKLGKRVQLLDLTARAGGEEVARARALRLRRGSLPDPPPAPSPPWTPPGEVEPFALPFFAQEVGYHRAVEVRFASGRWGDRSVRVWMRATAPLVAGEAASPIQRLLVVADAESGVCPPVDIGRFTFLNPDLTLVLDREPEGEWLGLEVVSTATELGLGVSQSALRDFRGPVGRSAQSLLVERRRS